MSITHDFAHSHSEMNHLLQTTNSFRSSSFRPRDTVLPFGRALLIGRPCLAIECLREAMNLRGLETDSLSVEQNVSACGRYDAFVIFLMRCEPSALTFVEQKMAELRVHMPKVPAIALIEDAETTNSVFTGMGFSTVVLGLPSASFAVDLVHLLIRGSRQIRDLANGASQVVREQMETEEREPNQNPADVCFTRRETSLLDPLRRGMQNKLIAHELGISESTVKAHLRSIMMKLKAKNRTQAVCILAQDFEFVKSSPPHADGPP